MCCVDYLLLKKELDQLSKRTGPCFTDSSVQTDPLLHTSLSIQTDVGAESHASTFAISGPVGHEIKKHKISLEGRVKGLVQQELLHTLSHQQALEDLRQQEEELESKLFLKQDEIECRLHQIHEKEELYRGVDASRLEQIRHQVS